MHNSSLFILCGAALLLLLAGPAACATTPLWVQDATVGGELSGVVISADGSTIVTGGDQLISLTRDGRKRWSGWSGTSLDISSQGDYILTSQGSVVRLISGAGTLLWDKNMEIAVKDISMAPDLSMIAAAGGGKVRTLTFSGEGIASNETLTINQVRIMPSGKQVLVTTSRGALLLDQKLMPEWEDTNSTQNLVAIAPGGSLFVTATSNRVRMYTGNGSIVWDKRYPVGDVQALAWSRDGSTIVLGLSENVVVLNRYGTQLFMANATDWITSVAVSDDGNTIAAGSLDKTLYVWNHAGASLGTFTVKNAIRPNSVAVTGDGQLIILVAQSAVYAFSRSSFTDGTVATGTVTETVTETTEETTTMTLPVTTTRKITTKATTLPTPYPPESGTAEAALPPLIPLGALLLLLLCRKGTG